MNSALLKIDFLNFQSFPKNGTFYTIQNITIAINVNMPNPNPTTEQTGQIVGTTMKHSGQTMMFFLPFLTFGGLDPGFVLFNYLQFFNFLTRI